VKPLEGSRKSPSGNDFDLYAESAWHALCAILFQDLHSRLHRGSYASALIDVGTSFGGRPFYRGQSRGWDIIPSAWRSEKEAERSSELQENFRIAIQEQLHKHPDPILEIVRRPDLKHAQAGLAQHYGIPTQLVDWTFNPLVAMCFACGTTDRQEVAPRELRHEKLKNCGVIYVVAAPALSTVAQIAFEFPPSYSKRLYQQKGMFADFGSYPGRDLLRALDDYSEQWCWLQQNSQRIFFPRTYPAIVGADELKDHNLMEGDEFFIELGERVRASLSARPGEFQARPPWVFDSTDSEQAGKRTADLLFRIDAYLRRACLVKFEDDDVFDPLIIGLLQRDLVPELNCVGELAELTKQPGLLWTAERLRYAYRVLASLR